MVSTFYPLSSTRKRRQVPRKYTHVKLSKDARIAIHARQKAAAHRYKRDVDNAWATINKLSEDLATTHHKSLHRVQGELHMGREITQKKRNKTSLWNAFCWKKRTECQNDESTSTSISDKFERLEKMRCRYITPGKESPPSYHSRQLKWVQ